MKCQPSGFFIDLKKIPLEGKVNGTFSIRCAVSFSIRTGGGNYYDDDDYNEKNI